MAIVAVRNSVLFCQLLFQVTQPYCLYYNSYSFFRSLAISRKANRFSRTMVSCHGLSSRNLETCRHKIVQRYFTQLVILCSKMAAGGDFFLRKGVEEGQGMGLWVAESPSHNALRMN